jgi:hypothetical protein
VVAADRDRKRAALQDLDDVRLDVLVGADRVADGDAAIAAVDDVVGLAKVDVPLE